MGDRRKQSSILALTAFLAAFLALVCGGVGWFTAGPKAALEGTSHAWNACLALGGLSAVSFTLSALFVWDDISRIIEQERRDARNRRKRSR